MAAAGPGGGQPGGRAFADEVAFDLGQGGEDIEHQLAARGGGVDRLLEAAEPNAAVGQAGDSVDQVPQGAAEPGTLLATRPPGEMQDGAAGQAPGRVVWRAR